MALNGLKWMRMDPNGPEWPRMEPNGVEWLLSTLALQVVDASGAVEAYSTPFALDDAPSLSIVVGTHPDSLDKGGTYSVRWMSTGRPFKVSKAKANRLLIV